MKLTVLGCHGGESRTHRPTSFLLDGRLALDAGAVTRALTLDEQARVESVLVSHAHFDHVRDLAMLADSRAQMGGPPIEIVGIASTLNALRQHFFNDILWPDFSRIPTPDAPTIRFRVLDPERPEDVAGYRVSAVRVNHTIDAVGFFVGDGRATLAFSGDTGPTERFWQLANETPDLKGVLLEVSFPDEMLEFALKTGHLSPALARKELEKLAKAHHGARILFHHLKPVFVDATSNELAYIDDRPAEVCRLDHEIELA